MAKLRNLGSQRLLISIRSKEQLGMLIVHMTPTKTLLFASGVYRVGYQPASLAP